MCETSTYRPRVLVAKQFNTLNGLLGHNESLIALHGGDQRSKNMTHDLAQRLNGRFSSIEEVEGKVLHSFVKNSARPRLPKRAFLWRWRLPRSASQVLQKPSLPGLKGGEVAKQSKATKYPLVLRVANA